MQAFYECIPHGPKRRLNEEEKEFARNAISLGADKRLVAGELDRKFGKIPTTKDLTNLISEPSINANDLKEAVRILQEQYSECDFHPFLVLFN